MNIYLDNAATTPLKKETKDYLIDILSLYGNPSSIYSIGTEVKKIITAVRKSVASFINTSDDNIYFTSGGSASNTLAIKGYYSKNNCCILYSPIAHKSIIECVSSCKKAYPLKVDCYGNIDFEYLKDWLDTRNDKFYVVIDYANSEIGTIQEVKKIIDLVHFYNGIIYLDCTGSISQIPLDVTELDVDMAGFSAHKLGGLKGCGVLYKASNIDLEPLVYGAQEQGLFGGTENVIGIASLGKAIESYNYSSISSKNRDYVYDYISNNITNTYIVGSTINRLPHNLYICFKGVDGESLLTLLDSNDIQVSTGSACTNYNSTPSTTLQSINMNSNDINSCIRMSFDGGETQEELDYACNTLKNCIEILKSIPVTPEIESDGYYPICPKCANWLEIDQPKCVCGQHLDWEALS